MINTLFRPKSILNLICILAVLFWLGLESQAWARAGGGRSSGSRSYSPSRSNQGSPSQSPSSPSKNYQQPSQPTSPLGGAARSFLPGLAGGLMGGLLGGMLFSSLGFGGNAASGGSGFGFGDILTILVILGIIYFVVKRFRTKQTMQLSTATAGASSAPYSYPGPIPGATYSPPVPQEDKPEGRVAGVELIKGMDPSFNETSFKNLAEDLFFKIQGSWTKRDLSGIHQLLSTEMLNILQQDVNSLLAEKKINRLENIGIRNVEIVDAGQDRGEEFITVKFQASLLDYTVDEKSGQILSGSSTDPVKFLEYWTFARNVGERNWVLAGITQEKDKSN